MSIGMIIALGATFYIGMFLLMYLVVKTYILIHHQRLNRSYIDDDIEITSWFTIILWPVSIPIWIAVFIVMAFAKSTCGIFKYLDSLSASLASKFTK